MLAAPAGPWVKYHNIVGVIPDKGILGHVVGEGDGVVSFASAHLDNVDSEIVVNADHTSIHTHPLSVLEVHRILLAHLAEIDHPPEQRWQRLPMTASAADAPWAANRAAAVPPSPPPMSAPVAGPSGPPISAPPR